MSAGGIETELIVAGLGKPPFGLVRALMLIPGQHHASSACHGDGALMSHGFHPSNCARGKYASFRGRQRRRPWLLLRGRELRAQ